MFIYRQVSACEVAWPVPFHAASVSLVLPTGTHSMVSGQKVSIHSPDPEANDTRAPICTCNLVCMHYCS